MPLPAILRRRVKAVNTDYVTYHSGEVFSAGAEAMVYRSTLGEPVLLFTGVGRVCGSFSALGGQPLVVSQALPAYDEVTGFPAGQLISQPLIDAPMSGS